MTGRADRREWLTLAWLLVPLALPLLLVGLVVQLGHLRVRVDGLQRTAAMKRAELDALHVPTEDRAVLDARRATLDTWAEMVAADSLRVAELSRLAWESGVTLRSLRGARREEAAPAEGEEPAPVIVRSHRVTVVGDYRDLATFLGAIDSARGAAAIRQLVIRRESGTEHAPLVASLVVNWYAPNPDAGATADGAVE